MKVGAPFITLVTVIPVASISDVYYQQLVRVGVR